jgi:hypothetical protein
MNVRRGMFRLWTVASTVFVIGVGIASYTSLHAEFINAYTDFDALAAKCGGRTVLPADCASARGSLGSDYDIRDGLCWYETAPFRRLYPEYKDLDTTALSEKLYAEAGRPLEHFHPWRKLAETAAIAFSVPFVALALGTALLWAFAGFTDQEKAPDNASDHTTGL